MTSFFWTKYPFVQVGLSFVAGIALAYGCVYLPDFYLAVNHWLLVVKLLVLLLGIFLLSFLFLPSRKRGCAFMFLFLLLGICHFFLHDQRINDQHLIHLPVDGSKAVCGKVINEPEHKNGNLVFQLRVTSLSINHQWKSCGGIIQVTLADSLSDVSYNHVLLLKGSLKPTKAPDTPYDFDYRRYLAYQGIHHTLYCKESKRIETNALFKGISFKCWAIQARQGLEKTLRQHLHDGKAYALASGLLIGKRSDLTYEDKQLFTNSGTIHILAVSGMHVVLIYQLITFLALRLSMNVHRMAFNLFVIAFIWFYIFITGLQASASRAALMITVVLIGKVVQRENQSINTLFASGFLMLLYNPYYIADAGFILSFLAVAGIILTSVVPQPQKAPAVLGYLYTNVVISLGAQIMTFPYSVHLFHQFPLYFLPANLLLVPLSTLILFLALLMLATLPIPYCTQLFGYLVKSTTQLLFYLLKALSTLPFQTLQHLSLSSFEMILLYAIVFLTLLLLVEKNIRRLWNVLLCSLLLASSIHLRMIHSFQSSGLLISGNKENRQYLLVAKGQMLQVMTRPEARNSLALEAFLSEQFIRNKYTLVVPHNQSFAFHGKDVTLCIVRNPETGKATRLQAIKSNRIILDYAHNYSYIDPKEKTMTSGLNDLDVTHKKSFFLKLFLYELD